MKQKSITLLLICLLISFTAGSGFYWTNYRQRNPQKGGWVSNGAAVDENVFIGPQAKVLGSASVSGRAKIYGNAVVDGEAMVADGAKVFGNAKVTGSAVVRGGAMISGNAIIGGDAVVEGNAIVRGYTVIMTGHITGGVHSKAMSQERKNTELRASYNRLIKEIAIMLSPSEIKWKEDQKQEGRLVSRRNYSFNHNAKIIAFGKLQVNSAYQNVFQSFVSSAAKSYHTEKYSGIVDFANLYKPIDSNPMSEKGGVWKIGISLKSKTLTHNFTSTDSKGQRTYDNGKNSYYFFYFPSKAKAIRAIQTINQLHKICKENPNLM